MSEGDIETDDVFEEKDSRASKKKFIIIGLSLLLCLGCLGVFLERGKLFSHGPHAGGEASESAPVDEKTVMIEVGSLISNLSSGGGGGDERSVYVKTTVNVEVAASCEAVVNAKRAVIEDILQSDLHETRREDIGGDGLYRLREAILRRLRVAFAPCDVRNVYFVDFLIQ